MASSGVVKAFLCSLDGTYNFPLMPKLTTIGRENCDILIINNSVDQQHAVIEFNNEDCSFTIHDLNSINGTYINDCRLSNASLLLTENDTIKFGFNGQAFNLCIQNIQSNVATAIPPIGLHRQSYNHNFISCQQQQQQQQRNQQTLQQERNSFFLNNFNNTSATTTTTTTIRVPTKPNHASLRHRPSSSHSLHNRKETIKINSCIKDLVGGCENSQPTEFRCQNQCNTERVDSITYRQDTEKTFDRLLLVEREIHGKEVSAKNATIKELKDTLNTVKDHNVTIQMQLNELDQIKRDKSIATGLVNSLQKDLSAKDITIGKLNRQIDGLKEEINKNVKKILDLEERINDPVNSQARLDKDKELFNLKARLKTTDDKIVELSGQVDVVRIELENSNKRLLEEDELNKNLKADLEQSHQQILDVQSAEKAVRDDLEILKCSFEGFKSRIFDVVYTNVEQKHEISAEALVNEIKRILREKLEASEKLSDLKNRLRRLREIIGKGDLSLEEMGDEWIELIGSTKKLEVTASNMTHALEKVTNEKWILIENVNMFSQKIVEVFGNRQAPYRSKKLLEELEIMKALDFDEIVAGFKDAARSIFMNHLQWLKSVEEKLGCQENEDSILTILDDLKGQQVTQAEERLILEAKLVSFDETVSRIESLQNQVEEQETQISSLIEKLAQASQLQVVSSQETSTLRDELDNLKVVYESCKQSSTNLEEELSQTKSECEIKVNDIQLSLRNAENNYNIDLSIHKEQIKQHALTIVSFEKDIIRYKSQEMELLEKIENLKEKKSESIADCSEALLTHAEAKLRVEGAQEEVRHYKKRVVEQDELIKGLRRDLAGASAKLSDTQGEMTEKQKRELEKNKSLVIEQQKELSVLRQQMAKLSEIIEKQGEQLQNVMPRLEEAEALTAKYKVTADENGRLAVELKDKLDLVSGDLQRLDVVKCEEGKITTELTAAGAQCRGERHEQVIVRQREALNELRQKIKALEMVRPNAGGGQLQQQVMMLKKELAEVRAAQAMNEDIAKHVGITRGCDESNFIIEEKTAHYETQTALESSEESYLTLVKTICHILGINQLDGLRTMVNLPCEERMLLNNERARSVETICTKLKTMIEKLVRKEDLLKDYEIDLAKLRQAEFLLDKKSEQLDEEHLYSRNKEDEIECLKESLRVVKTELERERLVNSAFKQKHKDSKNVVSSVITSVRRGSTDTLHHHCRPDDSFQQEKIKKTMNERIKKKDYELKTLKKEIKEKSEELSNLSKQVV